MTKAKQYLGIDWGKTRIGLALGDDETKIASPFKVVKTIEEIIQIVEGKTIDILVIGRPALDFSESRTNKDRGNAGLDFIKKYDTFICLLKRDLKQPIKFINENFTTQVAKSLPGNKKTKAPEDAIAAMIILQSYFDQINTKETNK